VYHICEKFCCTSQISIWFYINGVIGRIMWFLYTCILLVSLLNSPPPKRSLRWVNGIFSSDLIWSEFSQNRYIRPRFSITSLIHIYTIVKVNIPIGCEGEINYSLVYFLQRIIQVGISERASSSNAFMLRKLDNRQYSQPGILLVLLHIEVNDWTTLRFSCTSHSMLETTLNIELSSVLHCSEYLPS